MSDPITMEELYARALTSSHLESRPYRSAVDILIASGWCREGLGTMLYRLRVEFDQAKCDISRAAKASRDADWTELLQELGLIRMKIPHYGQALEAVRNHAIRQSRRHASRMRMNDVAAVGEIAGNALANWLDPLCPHCDGRGFNGGVGAPIEVCRSCHGSGRRAYRLHPTDKGEDFGRKLMADMERKTAHVADKMARFVRGE